MGIMFIRFPKKRHNEIDACDDELCLSLTSLFSYFTYPRGIYCLSIILFWFRLPYILLSTLRVSF
jgi:hypothetical protein